jgi:cytochrome c peroxidase
MGMRVLIAGMVMCTAALSIAVLSQSLAPAPGGFEPSAAEPISPVPSGEALDAAKLVLGEKLFRDPVLSGNGTLACTSCHWLDKGGDDRRDFPLGLDGRPLDFNSPSIFNVGLNFRLNWRGNFRMLEEQNEAVLLDPRLMGTSWPDVLAKLQADPSYDSPFDAAYGAKPTRESVLDALATFQRSLLTPNARFDRYLLGDRKAVTETEERGYGLFKSYGCIACHQGQNVGGNLFQKFGIFSDPPGGKASLTEADLGRFTITGREEDRQVFRVPSLRNVAVTAPYFHDGRTASLTEAVEIMGRSQLGRELPRQDVEAIVQFLGTLTGEYRGRPLANETQRGPP